MTRALFAVHLAVVLCSLPMDAVTAEEHDRHLQDRFVQGVKETWEELQYISFRARVAYTTTDNRSDTVSREYEVGIRGPNGLQAGARKNGIRFVQARNDAYAFLLHLSADGTGKSLQFLERIGVNPATDTKIAVLQREPREIALAAYYLWGEPLARVIDRDSFEITRVYAVPSKDHELVRVEFEYDMDDPSRHLHERYTDGYLVCDPARKWVVKEYGATFLNFKDNATGTMKTLLENADAIGEMPAATDITVAFVRNDMDYTSKTVLHLAIVARSLPEEELYLSHYGLPEPNFGRRWLAAWGWYLIGACLWLTIGAILVTRRKAKR